jgi:hypothetical protein
MSAVLPNIGEGGGIVICSKAEKTPVSFWTGRSEVTEPQRFWPRFLSLPSLRHETKTVR